MGKINAAIAVAELDRSAFVGHFSYAQCKIGSENGGEGRGDY